MSSANAMRTATCARRPLASGEQCIVEECGCGAIHLTIGALTLRLAPGTVADVSQTIAEAMQRWALAQLGSSGCGRHPFAAVVPGDGASS